MRSLGVTANGFKKLFDTLVTLFFAESWVRNMLARVILDDFLHQAVDGPASGGNKVQCFGAIEIRYQCPFNGLDLSGDTFYAFEKIVFVCCDMTHQIPPLPMSIHDRHTPYTYAKSPTAA
ncbi:hypothetical protein D3C81_1506590 [compost metagenome]